MIIEEEIIGDRFEYLPYISRSWLWLLSEIRQPAAINSSALNSVCVNMFLNVRLGIDIPKHIVIRQSCLNVERVIIFLSFS